MWISIVTSASKRRMSLPPGHTGFRRTLIQVCCKCPRRPVGHGSGEYNEGACALSARRGGVIRLGLPAGTSTVADTADDVFHGALLMMLSEYDTPSAAAGVDYGEHWSAAGETVPYRPVIDRRRIRQQIYHPSTVAPFQTFVMPSRLPPQS